MWHSDSGTYFCEHVSKLKANTLDTRVTLSHSLSVVCCLDSYFQPLLACVLISVAIIIRFCDRVYFHRVDIGVSHTKGVV